MLTVPIPADARPTLDVKLPDGSPLKLLPCKKSLVNKIFGIKSSLAVIDEVYAITAEILSCNTEGRVISAEDIEDWEIDYVFCVYKDYIKFMVKLLNSPN